MGSTVNISVTTHCEHVCKYPVVYLDGKARVEINKRKYKKKCILPLPLPLPYPRNPSLFIQPKVSLTLPRDPATGFYSEPTEYIPYSSTLLNFRFHPKPKTAIRAATLPFIHSLYNL